MPADRRRNRAAKGEMTPGQHLRSEIERLGLDQVAVRKATGVSRQTINNIVNDRQAISRAMAGKLARLTGHSADYWLRASFAQRPERATKRGRDVRPLGGLLVNFQIAQAIKDGVIGVEPFNEANLRPASMDLTLGDRLITDQGKTLGLGDRQRFTLKANGMVNVRTRERITLPHDYIGRVGDIDSMARLGLLTAAALQIAPGFDDHLQVCIFNSGKRTVELRGGMPIVCLELIPLSAAPVMAKPKRSLGSRRQ